MEGITQEAASLAGHLQSGQTDLFLRSESHLAGRRHRDRFHRGRRQAIRRVRLAHPHRAGRKRYRRYRQRRSRKRRPRQRRPSLILVHTHIGYGSPHKQDNFSAHGSPLGEEELQATKKALGWPTMDKFYLPQDAVDYFRQAVPAGKSVGGRNGARRSTPIARSFRKKPRSSSKSSAARFPKDWSADLPQWNPDRQAHRHAMRPAGPR